MGHVSYYWDHNDINSYWKYLCTVSIPTGPVGSGHVPITGPKRQKRHCHWNLGFGDFTCFTATTFIYPLRGI